jgi:hypothetical protein
MKRKSIALNGNRTWAVRHVANRYTDFAVSASVILNNNGIFQAMYHIAWSVNSRGAARRHMPDWHSILIQFGIYT